METKLTEESSPVLTKYLASGRRLPPATSLEECTVSLSKGERREGGPNWFDSFRTANEKISRVSSNCGSKRKLDGSSADGTKSEATNESSPPSSSFEKAVKTFLDSGCCVIPSVLPQTFVKNCHEKAKFDLELLEEALNERRKEAGTDPHLIAAAHRIDYEEFVARDGGRKDVRYDLYRYPYSAPGLTYNSMVMALVRELLGGGEITLLYQGIMWATPEKADTSTDVHQKWHADGGHLFHHSHQPPHCINVFFPLIDLTEENGPTEVETGSHILSRSSGPIISSRTRIPLVARAGDAILFDYRLQHRGRATRKEPRPILYLAYSKPWFKDTGNRRSGQSIFRSNHRLKQQSWASRLLTGQPLPMGTGFTGDLPPLDKTIVATEAMIGDMADTTAFGENAGGTPTLTGSGEQWVLFKLNVQLDGNENDGGAEIVVHVGDVPVEIATQFCLQHSLAEDFVPILAETIQQQMDARQASLSN